MRLSPVLVGDAVAGGFCPEILAFALGMKGCDTTAQNNCSIVKRRSEFTQDGKCTRSQLSFFGRGELGKSALRLSN